MYTCSICNKEVGVNHIDKPVFSCECVGATIVTDMGGTMHGQGAMNETRQTHNLTEISLTVIKSMMTAVTGVEFFREGKDSIFAEDLVIEDEITKRKFQYNITAKEI